MKIKPIIKVKNLSGKKILLRVDFNVPIKNGKVQDEMRIEKSLPTIKFLLQKGARVILVSHLGRPKDFDKKLSLKPVVACLEKLLNKKVGFIDYRHCEESLRPTLQSPSSKKISSRKMGDSDGRPDANRNSLGMTLSKMRNGEVMMLENIRFFADEEANTGELAKQLSKLADLFVLDGFAVAHRPAASVSGVAKYLPSYAGLLLAEEITVLTKVMENPKKPLVVVLGGAKAETKIPVLKNLLPKATHVLLGGGIANTYFWAKGHKIGQSIINKEYKKDILKYCSNKKVIMPVDVVVGEADGEDAQVILTKSKFIIHNSKFAIYDIGPATVRLFAGYIKNAQTIIMNGAMGMFEVHPYEYGTNALSEIFAARAKGKAFGVAGGGETVEVLRKRGIINQVDLVSTGGGAMLEFLSGKKLPGVAAVSR